MRKESIKEYLEELYKLGFRYLTTDAEGDDCVFKTKPEKCEDLWIFGGGHTGEYLIFSLGLTSWDDTEAKSIAEILDIDEVDWSKIPVDAKILVSTDGKNWCKRHFANYENGQVYVWQFGFTSWTTGILQGYDYAKLAEE